MESNYYIINSVIIIFSLVLIIAAIAIVIRKLSNTKNKVSMIDKAESNQNDAVNEKENKSA